MTKPRAPSKPTIPDADEQATPALAKDIRTQYDVTMEKIAEVSDDYAALVADTPTGYREVTLAIADCRTKRAAVEKRRKELKKDALEYGRAVDGAAKELIGAVKAIEEPLKIKKKVVDDAKAAKKQAAAEAKLQAEREAEEKRLEEIRAEQEARLAAEREQIEAERRELEEAKRAAEVQAAKDAEARRVEQEAAEAKLAAERAAIEEERQAEEDRIAAERAELDAERREVEKVTREQAEREAAKAEAKAAAEAEAKRQAEIDAMAPDLEKLSAWAELISEFADEIPDVASETAKAIVRAATDDLLAIAARVGGGNS